MFPAIFARTYPMTHAAEVLAAIAQDGYEGVQFNLSCTGLASLPAALPEGVAEEVGKIARANGLRIAALSGTYNMAHPDAAVRFAARAGFANVVEAGRRMGASVVTLCTGSRDLMDMWRFHPENASAVAWSDLRSELDYALTLVDGTEIRLGVEPEPGNVLRDAATARRMLDEVGSEHLGIVLDAANLLSPESLLRQHGVVAQAVALLGDSILLAHAKDIDASGKVVAAGDGAVDLDYFVAALRSVGYNGALIGHGFSVESARRVAGVLSRLAASGS